MENDAKNQDDREHSTPGAAPVSSSRRRLVLTTAPILLAVANRPAWANMCSISGAMSGPSSGRTDDPEVCSGLSPGAWKASQTVWPSPFTQETTFNTAFKDIYATEKLGIEGYFYDDYGRKDITLINLLKLRGNEDPYQAGAHICAGLLNAAEFGEGWGYSVTQYQTLIRNVLDGVYPIGIKDLEHFSAVLADMVEERS